MLEAPNPSKDFLKSGLIPADRSLWAVVPAHRALKFLVGGTFLKAPDDTHKIHYFYGLILRSDSCSA